MKISCASLLLVAAAFTASCDRPTTCTLLGCDGGFEVRVTGADGAPLPASTYEVALEIEGQPASLACGEGPDGAWFCEEAEGAPDWTITGFAETGAFSIAISGTDGRDRIGPDAVHVSIIAGDAPLADESFEPEYTSSEPNGEGCGSCDSLEEATIAIAVPEG